MPSRSRDQRTLGTADWGAGTATDPARHSACSASTEIVLNGRIRLQAGDEHTCRACFASSEAAEISVSTELPLLSKVTGFFEGVGFVEGDIRAVTNEGFLLQVAGSAERRARIRDRLSWLKQQANEPVEQRGEPRIVPFTRHVLVTLGDASTVEAEIADLSRSGAFLVLPAEPALGSVILVGRRYADVVRQTPKGIAVKFKLPLSETTFTPSVIL